MKRHTIFLCLLSLAGLMSCIRDEIQPCPPLRVKIGVADKNYENIADIEKMIQGVIKPVDENLPFRSYIPKLFYVLCDAETGEVVFTRGLHDVQGDAPLATACLPEDLPFGKYVLTVWGNIFSEIPFGDDGDYTTYHMHMEGKAGYDVYMTSDTLLYDAYHSDHTVMLRRAKGKLLILAENIPSQVNWSRKWISNLSEEVNSGFEYSERTYTLTESEWQPASTVSSQTCLSPTTAEDNSKSTVHVEFFDEPERIEPTLVPENVKVHIERNNIVALRYVYDEALNDFAIYMLVNDNWEQVHGMEIE